MSAFPTTQWTEIRDLRQMSPEGKREALANFINRYWPAIEACVRASFRGISTCDAEEYTQAFVVAKLFERDLLDVASASRGRLRDLLRTSIRRFCIDEIRSRSTGVRRSEISLEHTDAPASIDPEKAFDESWARLVIAEAQRRVALEHTQGFRQVAWRVFELRVLNPCLNGDPIVDYAELEFEFEVDRRQLRNMLASTKRTFGYLLRDVISEYAASESEIDGELKHLMVMSQA